MTLARCYYYVFYQAQLFVDKIPKAWPVEGNPNVKSVKGGIRFMDFLVSCWILALFLYLKFIWADMELPFSAWITTLILMLVIKVFNFWLLGFKGNWIAHRNEFVQWPAQKNRKGGWIVFAVVCLSVINVIVAYRLVVND